MSTKSASFRFYEELNDFLPVLRKKVSFSYPFIGKITVRDAIEELGVPHTQVDLIIVDGKSVDYTYRLQNGDKISVYPMFEAFDITPLLRLRPKPLRISKFILDVHLGKLAKYLRILGFDTLFDNHYADPEIVRISLAEQRIILTRDKGLLKDRTITHGYWVRDTQPRKQLVEVVERFQLVGQFMPFTRCLQCNGNIYSVDFETIKAALPNQDRALFEHFSRCEQCGKIYWEGSHFRRMQEFIKRLSSP